MLTVLGAVGTGIGVVGWVAFLGGAILWIKAAESDLPATEAVALTPKSVLLAQGAEVGALAVVAAVGAVGFLYLVDQILRMRPKAFRLGAAKELEDILVANVSSAADEAASARRQAAESRQLAEGARQRADQEEDPSRKRDLLAAADQDEQVAINDKRRADATQEGFFEAQRQLARHRKRTKTEGKRERRFRAVTTGVLLLGVPVAFAVITGLSLEWGLLVFGIAFLGSVFSFLILLRERWIWFGVAAFLTVSTVLTAGTYFKSIQEPKVEPAAVLREGAGPVCGFFVAQTSSHIYLGTYGRRVALVESTPSELAGDCTGTEPIRVATSRRLPPRLMSIPVGEVTDTAIGPPLVLDRPAPKDDAPSRSAAMALDLCERRLVSNGASGQAGASKQIGCTREQISRLREEVAALTGR